MTFSDALHELQTRGYLLALRERNEQFFLALDCARWHDIARELSALVGGQVWPTSSGLTWVCGSKRAWLAHESCEHDIQLARLCTRAICDEREEFEALKVGYSIGSCARALLKRLNAQNCGFDDGTERALMSGAGIGYFDCQRGQYDDVTQFDIRGCYFDFLWRLPHLGVSAHRGELFWHPTNSDDYARWRRTLRDVRDCKPLRNALWGTMLGKIERGHFYSKGELKQSPILRGPFRACALLVARGAWELCRLGAVERESIYSYTDCIITRDAQPPRAWTSRGFEVRADARGEGEICGHGIYKVGAKSTSWYRAGSRFGENVMRAPAPQWSYLSWS